MKPIIIFIISLFVGNAYAQYTTPTCQNGMTLQCNNYPSYQYDAAGNRTAKYNFCWCAAPPQDRVASHNNDSTQMTASPAPSRGGETAADVLSGDGRASILKIFPNPTNSTVTVEFTAATTGTLRVSDAMGKQLGSFAVSGNTVTVDISAYPAGTYLLTLIANDRIDTQRVVKADN